ncbi:hypothetical protein PENTCL1PPCAC_21661, partial [Pristionchus entomophagus]
MKTNEKRIDECVVATSGMLQVLYNVPDVSSLLEERVKQYIHIQDRLSVMEFLIENNAEVGIIHYLTRNMKVLILEQFQKTSWMNATSWFGLD